MGVIGEVGVIDSALRTLDLTIVVGLDHRLERAAGCPCSCFHSANDPALTRRLLSKTKRAVCI